IRLVAKTIRHGCHPRTLSGDNVSPAIRNLLSCPSCQSRCPHLWPFALLTLGHSNDNRSRHRCSAGLVWLRRATLAPGHYLFSSFPLAHYYFLPRFFFLS